MPRSPRDRVFLALRTLRRHLLRRRRVLAAGLIGAAVLLGLRVVEAPPVPAVTVAVAARDLPAGHTLRADDLTHVTFRPESVPDGVVDPVGGQALATPIRRGEPVTDARLVGEQLVSGQPGVVAVPVRLPDPGMVDLLAVGDRIDLVAADPQGAATEVVAYDVPVLAIAASDVAGPGSAGLSGRLVVVGADTEDVTEVAGASVRSFVTYAWSSR